MKHKTVGFGKGVVEVFNIVGYGTASLVEWCQMFQDTSARVEYPLKYVYRPLIKNMLHNGVSFLWAKFLVREKDICLFLVSIWEEHLNYDIEFSCRKPAHNKQWLCKAIARNARSRLVWTCRFRGRWKLPCNSTAHVSAPVSRSQCDTRYSFCCQCS